MDKDERMTGSVNLVVEVEAVDAGVTARGLGVRFEFRFR
jgi:hypothetical protein